MPIEVVRMRMRQEFQFALVLLLVFSFGCKPKRLVQSPASNKDSKVIPKDPGLTDANLKVNEGAFHNFGRVTTLQTSEVELTLYNSGVKDATDIVLDNNLAAPFTFKGGTYPGTGGSCGAILETETSCDLVLVFSPTAGGTFSDTFVLNYSSDDEEKEFTFAVRGSSGSATIVSDKDPTLTFENTLLGDSLNAVVTLTNSGALAAKFITDAGVLLAPFSYRGGIYPGIGGTCGIHIAAGASCTIVLNYEPTTSGTHTGAWGVGFVTGDSGGSASLILSGSSGTAELEFDEGPEFDFGNVFINQTDTAFITINNIGNFGASEIEEAVLLTGDFEFTGGTYPGTGGTCVDTLDAGDDCTINITFSSDTIGAKTGTLELSYDNGEEEQSFEIDFIGTIEGAVLEAETTHNFFRVAKNSTNEAEIEITNNGNITAASLANGFTPASPFSYKGFAYPGSGGTCTTSLAAGASCTIVIQYVPTGTGTGLLTHSSYVRLNYNEGAAIVYVNVNLAGQAGLGNLSFSGTTAWGNRTVGTTNNVTVTVSNNGTFDVSEMEEGMAFAAPFAWTTSGNYPGTSGTCGADLAPGGSCTLRVTYAPTQTGLESATLQVSYNNGESVVIGTKALSGTGVLAALTLSLAPSHDFGQRSYNNATPTQILTITNTGGAQATAFTRTGLVAPFAIQSQTCGATLNAGSSCTVTLSYSPTSIGVHSGTLTVNYTDGQAPQSETLDLDGEGINVDAVAQDGNETIPVDDPGTVIVLDATDENGDAMTYDIVTPPSNGSLGAVVGNTVTYTPDPLYVGPDTFTFRVHDGSGYGNTATVSIDVN